MKVLVTGATGFLGQKLVCRLTQMGYEIKAIGRNKTVGQQLKSQQVNFVQADLRDTEAMIAACKNQDYVFHCGALSSPWGKYKDFYETNVIGSKNIIQGCQSHGVQRLIYVSSPSVYFDFCDRFNIKENMPLPSPVNAYAKSKQLAEQEMNQAYQQGLPVISIRPRGIFGPGDTAILPRLIRSSNKTGIPLIHQGKSLIDITYVDNVVEALLLCQTAPDDLLGHTFNITNGEPIYVIDLLEKLFSKLNYPFRLKPIPYGTAYALASMMEIMSQTILFWQEPILTRYTVGLLAFSQTLDITAATQKLEYKPHISIEKGLDIYAQWWKTQPTL
ncbi:MAG: NAD-dependent epimerase/dehydratase family protein [Prochlorotrichaceae cyanobacterium]|jgi:nucleoside-diphosphate-sugar epimerase